LFIYGNNMEIKKDGTLSEWFKEARAQGYSFPLAMCHGIQTAMKELNKSFAEVFELFVKRVIIIQVGKMFIYDLRGHKALIPEGLHKCEKCGEYRGNVMKKDLNWEDSFHKEEAEKSEEYLGVSCLCDGILCHKCKKNKIHRPVSNTYYADTNRIEHYPYFSGMMGCAECREKQNKLKKPEEEMEVQKEWEVSVRLPREMYESQDAERLLDKSSKHSLTEQERNRLANTVVILFWLIVVFLTLYGLGGMSLVLNGVGFVIGVPILGLFFWGIYKLGDRFHWWG